MKFQKKMFKAICLFLVSTVLLGACKQSEQASEIEEVTYSEAKAYENGIHKFDKSVTSDFMVKSIKDFGDVLDANSIIGTPIKTDEGNTIIPVLKITVGYLGGGGEYGDIKIFTKEKSTLYRLRFRLR